MWILHKRYLNRIYNENRHPVHLSTTCDIFDDFRKYVETARKEEITGNTLEMKQSIAKIKEYSSRIKIYPGHGEITNLGIEKDNNPFLR